MPRQALIRPLMDIAIPVPMALWVFAMFLKAIGSKMILTHYIMFLNVLLWNKDSIAWVMAEWTKTILNGGGSPEIVIFQDLMCRMYWNISEAKGLFFVGDSMSRTQWESLICFLMTGVEDKKDVYEVNGNQITKRIRFLGVRFSSFNFTVEFFCSVFLVQHGWVPKNVPRRVRSTLKLDKLDNNSREWVHSDILIFNTGQWWVPGKLFQM